MVDGGGVGIRITKVLQGGRLMLGLGLLLSVALAEDPTPTTDLLDVQSNEISDTDEALYKRLLQDDQQALSETQILDVSSTEVELVVGLSAWDVCLTCFGRNGSSTRSWNA